MLLSCTSSSNSIISHFIVIFTEYFIGAVIALALVGITWGILKVCNKRSDKITNSSRYPLVIAVEEETLTIIPVPPTNYDTI